MSGLLPHVAWHAVASKTVLSASQSFALVALVVLVVFLLEREALRVAGSRSKWLVGFSIASLPLLAAVALTVLARLVVITQ